MKLCRSPYGTLVYMHLEIVLQRNPRNLWYSKKRFSVIRLNNPITVLFTLIAKVKIPSLHARSVYSLAVNGKSGLNLVILEVQTIESNNDKKRSQARHGSRHNTA